MTTSNGEIKVWDPFVRVFHWSLATAFFIAYFTEEDLLDIHVWAGYIVLGLVLARVLWGVVGSQHARFADFVYPWSRVKQHIREVMTFKPRRYIGHNPAGGLMIILLLIGLVLTSVLGLAVYGADQAAGPLAGWLAGSPEWLEDVLEETHEIIANLTLLLVLVHVSGVIVESRLMKENLVKAMITGRKPAQPGQE